MNLYSATAEGPATGVRRTGPQNPFVEFKIEWTERSILNRFRCVARDYRERVALKTNQRTYSYGDIDELSTRLGQAILSNRGRGAEPVALLLEHDAPVPAAMLGVLKAGKFYVTLDPFYPQERNEYILAETRSELMVTNTRNLPLARTLAEGRWIINLDELDHQGSECDSGIDPSADDLAYVFYTSGSTGKPKGVMHTHRSLLHNVFRQTNGRHLSASDRIGLLFSYSYGASANNTYGALLNGGMLLPFSIKEEGLDKLGAWLAFEEVTVLHMVPTVFRHFVYSLSEPGLLPRLRLIRLGGETMYRQDLDLFKKHFHKDCLLHVGMGSSETGMMLECFFDHESECVTPTLPAGYPAQDVEVLLLDESGMVVEGEGVGEIAVRGRHLSRGYWGRPDLTNERFFPDPGGSGVRTYRTGDLGYRSLDGCITHRGRKDSQIKIRGYRVEVEEIELALLSIPGIKEAVVAACEDSSNGDACLVAYTVPEGKPVPSPRALLGLLRQKLPDFMVPSAFVTLNALPLLPNGKVDRKSLPSPGQDSLPLSSEFLAPRTELEGTLTAVWAEVLRLERIGVLDSFFDLGGHSLSAARIASRVQELFGLELSLQQFLSVPTIAGLAEWIAQTCLVSRRVSEQLLLKPVPRDRRLPLSFAQQRLWLLDRLDPGSPLYNVPRAIRLAGALNIDALVRALTEIVRRHEALRTTFPIIDEQPVQSIAEPQPIKLRTFEFCNLQPENQEKEAAKWMRQEVLCPFDLQAEWPFRAALLRLKEDDHLLMVVVHHIVSDGWSSGILAGELSILYEAFLEGKPSPLPELSLQYADFACWQRQWLQGAVLEKQLGYWKKQLAGEIPHLELPTDRPRGVLRGFHGATLSFRLSQELTADLYRLSRREGTTLFMTLLAGFQALLYRYTGQEELLVGTVIANRNRVEIEGLIGFFVNTLVIKGDLRGQPTFRELLGRVRASAIDAYDHQDLPFEKLVEELQPERTLNQNPLFQVAFALQNAPRQELKLPHLDARLLRVDAGTAKFDLTLAFYERKEGLEGSVEYSTDLFDAARIERMIGHLQVLLEAVVANPGGCVSRLPLLKPFEKQQLLRDWNNTAATLPSDCVHQLFEAHAGTRPERIAIDFGGQQITYGQLHSRANALAHLLRSLGVGPEVRVGVAAVRSTELIVALLAVFKAGGAYVPLNPGYPEERLLFMVQDSSIQVLLACQQHEARLTALARKLPAESAAQLIWLDGDGEPAPRESIPNPSTQVNPDHLAYVIYTSGSTGTPKGVLVTHRNLSNIVEAQRTFFGITRESRVAQVNSPSFDVSLSEIWGALTTGAALCILPQEQLPGPEVVDWLRERAVSFLMATPSFLGALPIEDLPNLETVVSGGEACTAEMASAWSKGRQFVNAYGPTETTIWSTWAACLASRDQPPIGRPIPNTEVYVLDRQLEPVPLGIPGELFIGGIGVARGYLNRPDLTAEQFVPNPFSQTQGARLYRTGDKVQYRADGSLEFLGRLDHQVKIRGYRIELGEIESVLRQHPDVREAVVLVRAQNSGDKWLVGYVTAQAHCSPDSRALRTFLKERLPDYMLPADFVWLDKLPLNFSGKLDRRALPLPDRTRPELGVALEAPGTETEKSLAVIWMELLGVDGVGLRDNFFELGGHSLLATQVLARIQARLNVEVSLRVLFDNPTLAELAREIERTQSKGPGPIQRISRRPTG